MPRDFAEIGDEQRLRLGAVFARCTQHGRRMHRREHRRRPFRLDHLAPMLHDAEAGPEQRFCGGRAEADDDVGLDDRELSLEPWPARAHLGSVGRLVNPTFRARVLRPLEMLHRVGDVHVVPVDPGGVERAVEQLAGRADERPTGAVLSVARLLADDHDPRARGALTEDRLRRELVQLAAAAPLRRRAQLG